MKKIFYIISFVFLILFLVFPLTYIVSNSFFVNGKFSFIIFKTAITNYVIKKSIINSFFLGIIVVISTSIIGIPLAFLFTRYSFPFKNVLKTFLFLPLIISPFVGAIGMRHILSRFGPLNLLLIKLKIIKYPISWLGTGFLGIIILETLHLFPIMFLNISASLNNFDISYEEASYNLGATFSYTLRKITLPLLLPGYFAGSSIIFIWSLTDLGTPLVFEFYKLISVQVYNSLTDINTNPIGYALIVLIIFLTISFFVFIKKYIEKTPYTTGKSGISFEEEKQIKGKKLVLVYSVLFFFLIFSLSPHISIIFTSISGKWFFSIFPQKYTLEFYRDVFLHPLTKIGITNSIFYSSLSTLIDIFFGFVIGFILSRTKFKGRNILDILSMLPLAIPGIVIAFGYFISFTNTFLDPMKNPTFLLVLSYSIRRLPYLVRSSYSMFQQLNENLEEASYNLGASHFFTFRKIIIPLISPGLFAGGILVFAFSMLEVSSSLILSFKPKFYPIAKVIYELAGRVTDGPYIASALGVLGMILIGICFIISSKIISRKIGEFFRI